MNEQVVLAMVMFIGGLCWAGAVAMVLHRAQAQGRRQDLALWLPLTCLLGPLAAIVYLTEFMMRLKARIPPATPISRVAGSTAVLRSSAPLAPTTRLGSGVFLYIRYGEDACHAIELPLQGDLVIRRGAADEKSSDSCLILHDPSVSRTQHCRVIRGDQMELEDTSSNGTIVDGKVVRGTSVRIKVGSILRVGKTTLVVVSEQQIKQTRPIKP
jgi:hypothetical protein